MKKIRVELPEMYPPCLVILHPTGVEYEVQAGGYTCSHPVAEGFLVIIEPYDFNQSILETEFGDLWDTTEGILTYLKRRGHDLPYELPQAKDGELKNLELVLDTEHDERWGEAWVPVTCFFAGARRKAFLTWPNSD